MDWTLECMRKNIEKSLSYSVFQLTRWNQYKHPRILAAGERKGSTCYNHGFGSPFRREQVARELESPANGKLTILRRTLWRKEPIDGGVPVNNPSHFVKATVGIKNDSMFIDNYETPMQIFENLDLPLLR